MDLSGWVTVIDFNQLTDIVGPCDVVGRSVGPAVLTSVAVQFDTSTTQEEQRSDYNGASE